MDIRIQSSNRLLKQLSQECMLPHIFINNQQVLFDHISYEI